MKKLSLVWISLVGLLLIGQSAYAQPSSPKTCSTPEYRQFDFWVGDWDVFDVNGTLQGHNHVEKLYDGCVIQEHWRGVGGDTGSSFNIYDASRKVWHQTWVSDKGTLLIIDGGVHSKDMIMSGPHNNAKGQPILNRITWSPTADGVRQTWDASSDDGKTWQLVFDGFYRPAKNAS